MKLETLLTRYKTKGYKPLYVEKHLELANLNKWLFDNYKIFIQVNHHEYNYATGKYLLKFKGIYKKNTDKEYCETFQSEKYFDNPVDANFEVLRYMYRAFKFNNITIK